MRRGLIVFLVFNLVLLGFLLNSVSTLLTLLFEDPSQDAIPPSDIPSLDSTEIDLRPQRIPKIIHQTWKSETIPEKWWEAQQSCVNLHPDYEYKIAGQHYCSLLSFYSDEWALIRGVGNFQLWTDEKSREFIATEYPWFLETFDSYPYPIMRADSIRYFVLAHYGGIYIDLDDGCNRRLDPLLSYTAWVRKTTPTGISNDAMGSVSQHPFFLRVLESLQGYNRNWRVPYITVMYSTGPLFLSVIWKEYTRWGNIEEERVRILMPDEYIAQPWSFFSYHKGSSWHDDDAKAIFWMRQHWVLITVLGFIIAAVLYMIGFTIARKIHFSSLPMPTSWLNLWSSSNGYTALGKRDDDCTKLEV